MGPGKQCWPGHNRSAHCSTQAVQGQGSARAWRWRCAGSEPGKSPSSHSQGFGKLAGRAEANHQAGPKIQLHILLSSLPSMTEIYLHITEKETFFSFPCADRNLRKPLSVTDVVDACDSWLCDEFLRPFRIFVFQTQLSFVLLSQYFRKAITKIRSFRNPGCNSCICIQFQQ